MTDIKNLYLLYQLYGANTIIDLGIVLFGDRDLELDTDLELRVVDAVYQDPGGRCSCVLLHTNYSISWYWLHRPNYCSNGHLEIRYHYITSIKLLYE